MQSSSFDAARWFNDWSDNGGIAVLTEDRLYLTRSATIDREARARLDGLRHDMLRSRGGHALADLLQARRQGRA